MAVGTSPIFTVSKMTRRLRIAGDKTWYLQKKPTQQQQKKHNYFVQAFNHGWSSLGLSRPEDHQDLQNYFHTLLPLLSVMFLGSFGCVLSANFWARG